MKKLNILILTAFLSMPAFAGEYGDIALEAGLGVNYGGGLGVVADVAITPELDAFAGLGYAFKAGYVVGAKYYINDSVRLIANYGTNSTIEYLLSDKYEVFEGLNFGVGYIGSKREGWTVDLMYIDISNLEKRAKELEAKGGSIDDGNGRTKLSFGYRW